MQKNLVIVESPAKAKTIEKFLGKDYKVMSSYGHIRDLRKKNFGIDLDEFEPEYEIPEEKDGLVRQLKKNAKDAEVWLASDEDREGEAISWHLAQVLGLDLESTKRIVFHEITKNAILRAIENPRTIDLNLVNAQQARRMLDRIVGFKLSPVLWKKLKPSLSAGRVQSVCVRLIVEREREVEAFVAKSNYKVTAVFTVEDKATGMPAELNAELSSRFDTEEEAREFVRRMLNKSFTIKEITKKPARKQPAPPFTTSTLQQEAARKLGFAVSQTMVIAQRLYESGYITYMRTDSVNLSSLCIETSKEEIEKQWGTDYSKPRKYHTNSKGAQEAHEAIRPTYISSHEISGTQQEKRLYNLIWKRTLASQMADAELERTVIKIGIEDEELEFVASGEIITFDGFLKLYRESTEDEEQQEKSTSLPADVEEGQAIEAREVMAVERFTQAPPRYTEATLVRKLEELGIGRPSTYATIISTIQQREYVIRSNRPGEKRQYKTIKLSGGKLKEAIKTETVGSEKAKLVPTDIGMVVNDFLMQYFPKIMDYNFTANVEKDFDQVAEGKTDWKQMIKDFYQDLSPLIEKTMNDKTERKAGERILGTDPASGRQVCVKIGRFGPVVQIGTATDNERPKFAQLQKGQSIQTITLDEALQLFKLPRVLGDYQGTEVTIGVGKYGPYVQHNRQYATLPQEYDPLTISLDDAITIIEAKRQTEQQKQLKTFSEDPELEVRNGRFGPYIYYKGANYKLPKTVEDPLTLTASQCLEIVKSQEGKKKRR